MKNIFKNIEKGNKYVIYTLLFSIISVSICILFSYLGRSFINYSGDGFIQHFSVYVYLKSFYIEFFQNLVNAETTKMIDMSIGSGFDILTTLNYYGYGDLLSLIMIFFRDTVTGYNVIAILRLYFAGIAFIYFVNIKGENINNIYVILAGLSYAFSGFALQCFMTHSYFNDALIFLPLVLAGIEKYKKEKKKYLLIFSTAISFITNFYFAYMITLMAVCYEIFNICLELKGKKIKDILKENIKLSIVYIEGILLSCIVLLPIIYAFANNARGITESIGYTDSLLFYNLDYYIKILTGFIYKKTELPMWSVLSFGGFLGAAIIHLFLNKDYKKYKIVFILIMLGLCMPVVGKIFNGFSYVTNRWCFVLPLITSFIFLKMLPNFICLQNKDLKRITICFATYFMILVFVYTICEGINKDNFYNLLINFFVLCLTVVALKFVQVVSNKFGKNMAIVTLTAIFVISIIGTIYVSYIPNKDKFAKTNIMDNILEDNAVSAMTTNTKNEFFRTERNNMMPNFALISKEYNNSYYYSLVSKEVVSYYNTLGCDTLKLRHRLDSLNDRATLLALASVKYYIGTNNNTIPYGFHQTANINKKYTVYENDNYLPLGYMYTNMITREEFETLSIIEKEQVLLQAAVTEEKLTNEYKSKDMEYSIIYDDVSSPKANNNNNNTVLEKGKIIINNSSSKLKLEFEGQENSENYLIIQNPVWNSKKTEVCVTVLVNGNSKSFFLRNSNDNFYFNKENLVINLGYYENAIQQCEIYFNETGTLEFSSIKIAYSCMKNFNKHIQSLKTDILEDINITNNCITGKIMANEDGILQISIPYSIGWKAFIDGKESKIIKTNLMYMGLELEQGNHNIVFIYETPYLKLGAWISIGIIIILIIEIIIKYAINRWKRSIKKYQ